METFQNPIKFWKNTSLHFYEEIEEKKVDNRKRCVYGRHCKNFPFCGYRHQREDYFDLSKIKEIRTALNKDDFETLCQYNLGSEEQILELLNYLSKLKDKTEVNIIAKFMRYVDEKNLLRKDHLHIENDYATQDQAKRTVIHLHMISYMLARVYMLYFRDDITPYAMKFNQVIVFCDLALKTVQADDLLLTLAFHYSRGLLDSKIVSVIDVIETMTNPKMKIQAVQDHPDKQIILNAHKQFTEIIIYTPGFRKGLKLWVECSPFYGMCGLNNTIYIDSDAVMAEIPTKEAKSARIIVLLIHESAHILTRRLKGDFEVMTPQKGPEKIHELEAGYRFEFIIFGNYFEYKHWSAAATAIINDARWTGIPFPFDNEELAMIKKYAHKRVVSNLKQSGLEMRPKLRFEM